MSSDFACRLPLDRIRDGERIDLVADEAECAAIAKRLDLISIERLEAHAVLAFDGREVRVSGRIRAALEQSCIATGEPVPTRIDEPFELTFLPEPGGRPDDEVELGPDEMPARTPKIPSASGTGWSRSGRSQAAATSAAAPSVPATLSPDEQGRRMSRSDAAVRNALACDASGCAAIHGPDRRDRTAVGGAGSREVASATSTDGSSSAATLPCRGPASIQRCTPAWGGARKVAAKAAMARTITPLETLAEPPFAITAAASARPTNQAAGLRSQVPGPAPSRTRPAEPRAIVPADAKANAPKVRKSWLAGWGARFI